MISSVTEAITILDGPGSSLLEREKAARYLEQHPSPAVVNRLVEALQDDDQGVRWAASEGLAKLGQVAVVALLQALQDPKRVGDPRLRAGVYHVLRASRSTPEVKPLMDALHALTVADLASMIEAERLLRRLTQTAPTEH